ncbi:AraC family transcriptional regulator [Paenibacillus senegalensis]|uniref:AraC family transcriptional regulator n=1 Tax=Paenibacillus senegalensis TaxID=1465766 RepID=UPI000289BA17|nr:AraC family transcriptional regulator [Paenibacillus senegalensis]
MTQSLMKWLKYNIANTQTRLVFIMTISVFLIIVAVGITSYYTSKTVLQEELSEPQHQLLHISMDFIDSYIQESNQLAIKVALNSNVYKFFTDEEQNSYHNITELYQFLETLVGSAPYIKSVYIYDMERGSFVAFPQGFSSSNITFADSEWVEVADQFGDEMMMVKKREVPEGTRNQGSDITLFRKIMIQGEFKGMVAVNFKNDDLFRHMTPPAISALDSRRFILDQSDEPLYAIGNYAFETEAVNEAISQIGGERLGEFRYEDKLLLAYQLQSPVTGWRYVSIISQDSLLANSKKIRDVVIYVSIAALVLGGLAILYFNAVAFKPVRRMRQLLQSYERDKLSPDLIDLEKITGELLNDHAQLSRLIRQTMPEASSKFLLDVCTGNMSGKREIFEKWNRYFKGWTDAPLRIVIVSVDNYKEWCGRFPKSDHSLLKFAVSNIIAELVSADWRMVYADLGKDRTAILLQPAGRDEALEAKLEEAAEIIAQLLKFTITIGISAPHSDACKLKHAMFEAGNALSYRLYRGYGQIIAYEEVSEHEMAESFPQDSVLTELAEAVEAGSRERALRIIERTVEDVRRDYWYPSAAVSFYRMAADKLDRIFERGEAGLWDDSDASDFETMLLDDIQDRLQKQVELLAERFSSLTQSKDFILCQRMIEYMKGHLEEPVGIQEIADSAGISVSLASQLFKQEMNDTIYGYFTRLRMERAGELLLMTDHKISEIASMVGYQHENSFIRVYRKYKDITPGKYREMMKNREGPASGLTRA